MPQDLAVFKPTVWSQLAIIARSAALVMGNIVTRSYETDVREYGDEVDIPTIGNLTVGDVPTGADGTEVTFQTLTPDQKKMKLNRWKHASFRMTKKDLRQMRTPAYRDAYMAKAGTVLAEQIDVDLLGQSVNAANTVGATATDLTDATIRNAKKQLDLNNVPRNDRHLVIDPSQEAVLLGIDKYFTAADLMGKAQLLRMGYLKDDGAIVEGYFGRIYGIDVWSTTSVTTDGASPLTTRNLMFHRSALALVIQLQPLFNDESVWYDKDEKVYKVSPDQLYGIKTLRPDHMVLVKS